MQGLRPRGFNKSTTPPSYMKLFNASSAALKSVSPQLRVGGPALVGRVPGASRAPLWRVPRRGPSSAAARVLAVALGAATAPS
jgi:hypothetical protein